MFDWLKDIPNLDRNVVCGSIGALIVIMFQLYNSIPEIRADIYTSKSQKQKERPVSQSLLLVLSKALLSVICASLVTALLIRPEENYGALITGMTWPTVIKGILNEKKK